MSLINFMASVNKNHMEMGLCEDKKGTVYDERVRFQSDFCKSRIFILLFLSFSQSFFLLCTKSNVLDFEIGRTHPQVRQ